MKPVKDTIRIKYDSNVELTVEEDGFEEYIGRLRNFVLKGRKVDCAIDIEPNGRLSRFDIFKNRKIDRFELCDIGELVFNAHSKMVRILIDDEDIDFDGTGDM